MSRSTTRVVAALAALTLATAACGDDDATSAEAPADTTTRMEAPADTATSSATDGTSDAAAREGSGTAGWTVDGADCVDPDRIHEPIEGTVKIASAGPLSGGPAASAFAPAIEGLRLYIDYANEHDLLPGYEIELSVGDDQYDPALTPGVINNELDNGAHLVSAIIGTPQNHAVRDILNEECIPQLLAWTGGPGFNDVATYPWTTGSILPYEVEAKAYAEHIGQEHPDGATAAIFYVNIDSAAAFKDGFEEVAGDFGIDVVDVQTIEAPETAPPAPQVSSIAGEAPDAIVAFPLGAQCPTFLTELANAKAANPGWEPAVYLTSTCSGSQILAPAGDAATGLYSAPESGLVDISNPANHGIPGVATYLETAEAADASDTVPTSAAGWQLAELTVEILRQAAESPEGLTQASIINAARNFEYTPSMARDGAVFKLSGEQDGNMFEDVQILQYDADTQTMADVGELITTFRSS